MLIGDYTEDNTVDDTNFAGCDEANKMVWLFISRIKDTATEETIANHIKKMTSLKDEKILVKQIKTSYERTDRKCFQIGVDTSVKDQVYKPCFWPKGVAFRRYTFRKSPNYQQPGDFLGQINQRS